MSTVKQVMARLKEKAKPDQLAGMKKYGMSVERRLGLSMPDMRKLAKELGKRLQLMGCLRPGVRGTLR